MGSGVELTGGRGKEFDLLWIFLGFSFLHCTFTCWACDYYLNLIDHVRVV